MQVGVRRHGIVLFLARGIARRPPRHDLSHLVFSGAYSDFLYIDTCLGQVFERIFPRLIFHVMGFRRVCFCLLNCVHPCRFIMFRGGCGGAGAAGVFWRLFGFIVSR